MLLWLFTFPPAVIGNEDEGINGAMQNIYRGLDGAFVLVLLTWSGLLVFALYRDMKHKRYIEDLSFLWVYFTRHWSILLA
jgi:hypothetical protein